MKFSICRENITPSWPMRMAGYRCRVKPFEGVYDPLYVTTLLLDDGNRKTLLISIDVCMIDRRFAMETKAKIKAGYGICEDGVVLHAIHTHAGPAVMLGGVENDSPDRADVVRFRELLQEKILLSVKTCLSSTKEGTLAFGTGETYIGMNRRQKKPDGGIQIGPNPDEEIDRRAYAMTIRNTDGKIEAVVFCCPCHAVVLYPRNMFLSADFPGAARAELEKKIPGAITLFLQGSGADINPAILTADDEYRDTFYSDVLFTGRILANDIYNIIQKGMAEQKPSLSAVAGRVILPLSGTPKTLFNQKGDDAVAGEVLATVLELSDTLRIIGIEGEVCNRLGVRIREAFPDKDTVVLGYVNGWIGYIPTAKVLRDGGYESVCSRYGEPFGMTIEEEMVAQLKVLAEQK